MIIKRQKEFGFLSEILGTRSSMNRIEASLKRAKQFTPEIEKQIKQSLPKEYTKLERFDKEYSKYHEKLNTVEFGIMFNSPWSIWEYQLSGDIKNLDNLDRIKLLSDWDEGNSIYWNLKFQRYEDFSGHKMTWQDIKTWMTEVMQSLDQEFSASQDHAQEAKFCKRMIQFIKSL